MPQVKGTPGYIAQLEKEKKWPVNNPQGWNKDNPTTTPYLVVLAYPGDIGDRAANPLKPYLGFNSISIDLVDAGNHAVVAPAPGGVYTLSCRVANGGSAGAYTGLAEFRVAGPSDLDAWAAAAPGANAPLGYGGFSVDPGQTVSVKCVKSWTAPDPVDAYGVLVQVYDLLLDPLEHPFDAASDRHIGRRDFGVVIVNKQSGKCLDIIGGNQDDNAPVQQNDLNGQPSQRWIRRRLSGNGVDTVYTLTAEHSNKCMDVTAGSIDDHAVVQQYKGHGGWDQQWKFQPVDGGYFFITSENSHRCLNVPDGSLDNGVTIEQLGNQNLDSQKWQLQWAG